ncbi:MAG: polysaccharide pyruvyl transferase CsaB [Clostridia bacterium]|nr:polysaccharide pyruvyl transferase CsaB [Clostridia bacterium]
MKKILMTTMSLDIGGAETHITELCKALTAMGYKVTVASGGGVYVPTLEAAGVKHVTLPLATKHPVKVLKAYMGLRKLIKTEDFDVVHAHARIPAFICGLLSRKLKFRFVTTAHGTFDVTPLWKLITDWGEKSLSVSYDIKEYLINNYGIPADNISLTVNGIDVERFSGADPTGIDEEFDLAPSSHRLLYLSRIDGGTAPAGRTLLEAAETLAARYSDLQVLIVGGGTDFDEMQSMAEALNGRCGRRVVTMTGPRTDVHRFCAWPDVGIGVSRAILEIMSASKPVVLMGTQGGLGIFDESTLDAALKTNFTCRGYPCLTGNETAEAISALFDKTADERAALGQFGIDTVSKNYSITRMAQDAADLYESMTPKRRCKYGDIVMGGYYGYANLGDDSLLQVVTDMIRSLRPDARITVLSGNPKDTGTATLLHSVGRFNPFRVVRAFMSGKVLIFGGGSQLQSATSSRSLSYYLWLLRLAKLMGLKTVLFANGIGPFASEADERRVAKVLQKVDLITLRDTYSREKLTEIGVTGENIFLSADPAFLMKNSDPAWCAHLLEKAEVTGDYFVLSLRKWKHNDPDLPRKVAHMCRTISEKYGITPLFLPMQTDRDLALCTETALLAGGKVLRGLSAGEAKTVISGARFVCGMRLHLLIYAAATGVPAMALSYDPKVDAFFTDTENPLILSVRDPDPAKLSEYAEAALAADRQALAEKAKTFKEKAYISLDKAKDLI